MLYPSIDKLLVEIDSKYSLVILSSKRAHELHHHAPTMLESYKSYKNVGRALEEVVAGDLWIRDDSVPVEV
ncbi:DNA-directed RNA polymerase subunit omega [Granulicatella sp. s8]|uniref:DNA-directed RNA polymerase subunit omega n=2 Tax=Granulicatella seriolae TaxID=2967226 RepID=A0ABT1WMH3_9LACT